MARRADRLFHQRGLHAGAGGGACNEAFKAAIQSAGGFESVTADQILEIRDRLIQQFGFEECLP